MDAIAQKLSFGQYFELGVVFVLFWLLMVIAVDFILKIFSTHYSGRLPKDRPEYRSNVYGIIHAVTSVAMSIKGTWFAW